MYKPLPDTVTIRPSSIEGLGLFAKVDIPIINEKTEAKIMNDVYDTVEGVIKKVIMEKL